MIGTIRKHSSWLWWVVAGLTIISFIWWGASPATRNGGAAISGFGTIYGKKITTEDYNAAEREYFIYYWRQHAEFPDRTAKVTHADIERETYTRLLLSAKAKELGIHVSNDAEVIEANNFLRGLGRDGEAAPMSLFLEKVLQPEGLDASDFQRFIADNLAIDQLIHVMGMSGALVPPQEAGQLFERENQQYSAQAVFFSASNYLSRVSVTTPAVGLFYTNYMAHYRLPDRAQVNYLAFDLTNFAAAAEQKLGKTNIAAQAESYYAQKGADAVPDAKTPEEAKAKIREMIVRQAAAVSAEDAAKEFLKTLFAMSPVSADNLVTLAKTNGLTVHTTSPFSEEDGPQEFLAPPELIKDAFELNADSPFSIKPIRGTDAIYIIALANRLPSEIPPLDLIRDRVERDYQYLQAALQARTAGTNFYYGAIVKMATGQTFAQVALAAGQTPFSLKPFSLTTQDIPEAAGHADVREILNTAFTTQPGHISPFELTAEGGFVLFVKSILPVDEQLKSSELPKYLLQLRHQHEMEAFNIWLQLEENRELRNTPLMADMMSQKSPANP